MAASSSVLGLTMLEASQPGPTKPAPQLPLTWPTAAVWALVSSWRQRCGRWCRWTWGEARDGGGRSSGVEGVAVVPGAAGLEADPLIEPARRLPRRPRGEIHRLGPGGLGQIQCLVRQDLADSLPPGGLIDDHVLDPGAEAGGNREHHQGQRARDADPRSGGSALEDSWGVRRRNASSTSSVTSRSTSTCTVTRAHYRSRRDSIEAQAATAMMFAAVASGSATVTSNWLKCDVAVSRSTRTAGCLPCTAAKALSRPNPQVPRVRTPGIPAPGLMRTRRRLSRERQGCGSTAAARTAVSGTRTFPRNVQIFSRGDRRTTRSPPSTTSAAIRSP